MLYKLIIKKVNDEQSAQVISRLIGSLSGVEKEKITEKLLADGISLECNCTEEEKENICSTIQGMGVAVQAKPAITQEEEDDDEDMPSDPQNLIKNVDKRKDIFEVENERKLLGTLLASMIIGLVCGFWFNGMEFIDFSPDFFERLPEERAAKLVVEAPKIEEKKKEEKKEKKERKKTLDKKKKVQKVKGGGGGGSGDPRAKITQKGVLGIISGKAKGKTVFGGDVISKGFAKDIDAILESVGGLKTGGQAGKGRKGLAKAGFGKGYGGGGLGSGGIDDMLGGLFGGAETIGLKKRGSIKVQAPKTVSSGPMSGGRTKEQIMRVVMQHIAGLRYSYNKRLKVKPGMKGKITVRFHIDPAGKVVKADVVGSTMGDSVLEKEIVRQILRWRFDPVSKKGMDVVEYPFAFSQ